MAAVTDVSICAAAMVALGSAPISNFTDADDHTVACARLYPMTKSFVLSIYNWRFTMRKRQLARVVAAPLTKWNYYYQLPTDRLTDGIVAMFDTDAEGASPTQSFELFADGRVAASAETVWIDYQVMNTIEAAWPPYFVELMKKAMMVELTIPVTDNATLRTALAAETYGSPVEYPNGGLVRMARQRNASEDPSPVIATQNFTLVEARFSGV